MAKRFSMIREFHFADWFTLANAVSGMGAVLASMTYLETHDTLHVYLAQLRNASSPIVPRAVEAANA